MARKKIGGCLFLTQDIKDLLTDSELDGIAFKIDNPSGHTSVDLDLYGAKYNDNGLQLNSQSHNCNKDACDVGHSGKTDGCDDYTFEHMGEFTKFVPEEPLVVYFTRSQIEMILILKDFEYIMVCSYIPHYCDIYQNIKFHGPNFSLMIQPYQYRHAELIEKRDKSQGEVEGGNKTTIIFGAACPKRWVESE